MVQLMNEEAALQQPLSQPWFVAGRRRSSESLGDANQVAQVRDVYEEEEHRIHLNYLSNIFSIHFDRL